MARFITATDDVTFVHPETGEPFADAHEGASMPWGRFWRLFFRAPDLPKAIDVFTLMDMRAKFLGARKGQTFELADDEWSALLPHVKRPTALGPDLLYCPGAEEMLRAVSDAPTKPPG